MIRHTVLLTFDGADEAAIEAVVDELGGLPAKIPEIRAYTIGRDLGLSEASANIVVTGDFDSVEDYRAYSTHPEHLRVIEEHIRPGATAIARAQIELD